MEKKIEDSKPILNRTRRQLLMGAALTPVVMTLHSAKVFAQDADGMNPSGLAPFSAVLIGSAGLNNAGGTEQSECTLYETIVSTQDDRLCAYYGKNGSGTASDVATLATSGCGWSFNSEESNLQWTQEYERKFMPNIQDYATAVLEIQTVANAIQFIPASWTDTNNPVYNIGTKANLEDQIPSTASKGLGVFAFVCGAKFTIDTAYLAAVQSYNSQIAQWNTAHESDDNFNEAVGLTEPSIPYRYNG